jgi:aspartate aminotransferase-like enzyme
LIALAEKNFDTKIKLFTPGPVYCAPDVLAEMAKPCDTHRSRWYYDLHKDCTSKLQKVLYTKNDVLLGAFSATGFMEACVSNTLGSDDTGLFIIVGEFGNRWKGIAESLGKKCDTLDYPGGKAARLDDVKKKLQEKKYATVFIQYNETSTGVRNNVEQLAPVIKDAGALLCVDAVSAICGMKIEVDKMGIDACLASVQKCFGTPPGLSVCSVSPALLGKAKTVKNRGNYLDMIEMKQFHDKAQTPTTPPIPQIRALAYKLGKILNEEGLENRFKRHDNLAKMTRDWAKSQGFTMFSEEGHHSSTVSTIANNKNIDVEKFVNALEGKGYRIVTGYGQFKKVSFRIGHMGDLQEADMKGLFAVMDETLKEI